MAYFVIIPAAGTGQRMQADRPKQYLSWQEKPLLHYAIEAFIHLPYVSNITVALAPDDHYWPTLLWSHHEKVQTALGANTRAQSVLNALYALKHQAQADDWVLVHDAARPFITAADIERLVTSLSHDPVGGILAWPSSDTLKTVVDGVVQHTLARETVWQAQTPQMFRYGLLLRALDAALQTEQVVTDESSAMESAKHSVKVVLGSLSNRKVTYLEDL